VGGCGNFGRIDKSEKSKVKGEVETRKCELKASGHMDSWSQSRGACPEHAIGLCASVSPFLVYHIMVTLYCSDHVVPDFQCPFLHKNVMGGRPMIHV